MIRLHAWHTPNGRKISVMLEECALPYEIVKVNLSKGEQLTPEFTALNPSQKIPVLVDGAVTLAESGAILWYLGKKDPEVSAGGRGALSGPAEADAGPAKAAPAAKASDAAIRVRFICSSLWVGEGRKSSPAPPWPWCARPSTTRSSAT